MNYTITYAQNREDILLNAFFDDGEVGFYIDVGAEAPTALSVTKIFYDRGWRGINIEPIKRQYDGFVVERPRDINLNVGVSDQKRILRFREYEGSGYSTFSSEMKKEHQSDDETLVKDYKDYDVKTRTLRDICDEYKVSSIQFLKVDVEGLEYEVLKGNDWSKYRPEVICIEANHIQNDWRILLNEHQYDLVFFDGLNEYYVDSHTDRAERFDYVHKVVFKEPIVRFEVADALENNQMKITELEENYTNTQDELILARNQITELQGALNDVTPLRRHIIKSFKHRLVDIDHNITSRLSRSASFDPLPFSMQDTIKKEGFDSISEYDLNNYLSYARQRRDSPLLPVYRHAKIFSHRLARRVLTKTRTWK